MKTPVDTAPISRFPVAEPAGMPADLKETIDTVASKTGFTPNVFLAWAWRPEQFRAFFGFYETLMRGESGLSRAEREAIAVAVSAANACTYCTVAHGAALRILAKDPRLADLISANHRQADLSPRHRAMLDFAVKVTREPGAVEDEDIEALRAHGFVDADIWDIGAVAAFFNLSNRMASLAAMRPNREFHSLGRNGSGRPHGHD
jgi:uncharacterized peroxidase-related enzyme